MPNRPQRASFLRVLRGEIRKIMAQRGVSLLLVWLWPLVGVLLPLMLALVALANSNQPVTNNTLNAVVPWTSVGVWVWIIPTNIFGRLLFIALASAMFALEYQWGTWKTTIPRADRIRLVLVK